MTKKEYEYMYFDEGVQSAHVLKSLETGKETIVHPMNIDLFDPDLCPFKEGDRVTNGIYEGEVCFGRFMSTHIHYVDMKNGHKTLPDWKKWWKTSSEYVTVSLRLDDVKALARDLQSFGKSRKRVKVAFQKALEDHDG